MYYLRTKSAVDAIKFTLDNKKKAKPVKKVKKSDVALSAAALKPAPDPSNMAVEPLNPEELKETLTKTRENEANDCLMCVS